MKAMLGNLTLFYGEKFIEISIEKRLILTQSIEKSFVIDLLNTMQYIMNR